MSELEVRDDGLRVGCLVGHAVRTMGQRGRRSGVMKLQHYIGGLEGLPEPLTLDRRVFAEEWQR